AGRVGDVQLLVENRGHLGLRRVDLVRPGRLYQKLVEGPVAGQRLLYRGDRRDRDVVGIVEAGATLVREHSDHREQRAADGDLLAGRIGGVEQAGRGRGAEYHDATTVPDVVGGERRAMGDRVVGSRQVRGGGSDELGDALVGALEGGGLRAGHDRRDTLHIRD